MTAARSMSLADHFDPLALSLINRYSPQAMASVFGAQASRANPPMSIKDVAGVIQVQRSELRGNFTATITSDDFARIVNDVASAAGLIAYLMNPPEILRISHETNEIDNFLPQTRPRADIFPKLLPVDEGAEITYGSIDERGETYQAIRYARLIELTEQMFINDKLGLVMQPLMRTGEAVADLKAATIVDRIVSNPVMSDGKEVFHAEHGNVAAEGAGLNIESLTYATMAMRRQKHIDGERPIDVTPSFLVVPPELETPARQLVATITPATTSDVNPFARKLEVIVEPRFTDPAAWYLFASPARQLGMEHGTVNGTNDPEVRTEARMERHAVLTRVTADFAAGWIDWRGVYKNPGEGAGGNTQPESLAGAPARAKK
jgi:Mu-like prophage major head subunit gpT